MKGTTAMIRISAIARSIAAQQSIAPEFAWNMVRATVRELEIKELFVSERVAGEIEAIVVRDLAA